MQIKTYDEDAWKKEYLKSRFKRGWV